MFRIIVLFLFIFPLSLTARITDLSDQILIYLNSSIPLDAPLITIDEVTYFPVRDWADASGVAISYSRRDDVYTLNFNKKRTMLYPRSREISIEGNLQYLPAPSYEHSGRLYAPLNSFFEMHGFDVAEEEGVYRIGKNQEIPPPTFKKILEKGVVAELPLNQTLRPSALTLPAFESDEELYIVFGLNSYTLKGKFLSGTEAFHVNLTEILKKENFSVSVGENSLTIKKANQSARFSTLSNDVVVNYGKNKTSLKMLQPLIIKNGKPFVPLLSLLSAFNLVSEWDPRERNIQIFNTLQSVQLTDKNQKLRLRIESPLTLLASEPAEDDEQKSMVIDLSFTKLLDAHPRVAIDEGNVYRMEAYQLDDKTVRLQLFFKEPTGFLPLEQTIYGGTLSFSTSITKIIREEGKKANRVTIVGNGPFKYKYMVDKKNKKLVIDCLNTVSQLPQIYQKNTRDYRQIRSSQFKHAPPTTRIVFDLTEATEPTLTKTKNNLLTVSFPRSTVIKAAPETVITKTHKKGMRGRIIYIDPGHGGGDPGAVVRRRIFEKKYTLDISKRLKKLCEDNGAYVVMAREGDQNPSLRKRSYMANKNNADVLISVHINSFRSAEGRGTETYYYKRSDRVLGKYIHNELKQSLKLRDNGLKKARMYILRNTKMPGVLVEPLFITHPREFNLLQKTEFRQKIATALFRGIDRYFQSN